jgi:hypothetical protein
MPRPRFTPGEMITGTHWIGGWVGRKAGRDREARGKIILSLPVIKLRSPGLPVRSQTLYLLSYSGSSHLGGVVISMLATRPKVRVFEPCQGDVFLRAIKIRSTHSSWVGSKAGRSNVVRFYGM